MSHNGLQALESELGASPPAGVAALGDAVLRELASAVRSARHRQAAELGAAGDRALEHIPRLLRLPIRKALG